MYISEQILSAALIPRLNALSSDVDFLQLRCREGFAAVEANIRLRSGWIGAIYRIEIQDFRFDAKGRYVVLRYREDSSRQKTAPLGRQLLREAEKVFTGKFGNRTLLMNAITNTNEYHISEDQITIQLSALLEAYPELQHVSVRNVAFTNSGLHLDVEVAEGAALSEVDLLNTLSAGISENIQYASQNKVSLAKDDPLASYSLGNEQEYQRFYDRLRARVEAYVRERVGASKTSMLAPYLLLIPDLFVLLVRLLRDERVSKRSKSIAMLAIGYFVSPLNLIPEILLGPIGFTGDIVVAVMALNKMLVDVDESIIKEHWNGQDNIIAIIRDVVAKADSLVGNRRLAVIKNLFMRKK
ncbi:DUF1232 domain-containing protein [Aneurinibacillus sp. Ricciae_BoGa-3]|uniref:YkvA family protein n=1 Tax=Aneurinibacillus sp. Ricciae_BoGa-3 TaxID=3022697 RepID=UPI002341C71F|nr:DUF1232 domain-containing protein [Aneurinibacillus sp. Ricciae_BoGa-3]WCK55843.1 DUF1232 domain-containing protein [Aneurinibacillus sp. Ricciae_BoGa-3]